MTGTDDQRDHRGPSAPAIMMGVCYAILAATAYLGWHQAFIVGSCYLALGVLVIQVHGK